MPVTTRIALNYRREDTSPWAGRVYDRLSAEFGRDRVFMDIDALEPGVDFVDEINKAVASSQILIAMIGPDWVSIKDAKGNRRLDNPMDFVRMEIVAALKHNIRVIPVLVGGAMMPQREELPEDLAVLARRNAVDISDTRFHSDVDRLIGSIKQVLARIDQSATPASGGAAAQRKSGGVVSMQQTQNAAPPAPSASPPTAVATPAAPPVEYRPPPAAPTAQPKPAAPDPAIETPGRIVDTMADVRDILGAEGSRARWKQWVILGTSQWLSVTVPMYLYIALSWELLFRQWRVPLAFASVLLCLTQFNKTARAIVMSGLVYAAIKGGIDPRAEYGDAIFLYVDRLALFFLVPALVLAVAWRKARTATLMVIAAIPAAITLWQLNSPNWAGVQGSWFVLWLLAFILSALWPIVLLATLKFGLARFQRRWLVMLVVWGALVLLGVLSYASRTNGNLEPEPILWTMIGNGIAVAGVWLSSRYRLRRS